MNFPDLGGPDQRLVAFRARDELLAVFERHGLDVGVGLLEDDRLLIQSLDGRVDAKVGP